jgi:hypothetical protein
MRKKLTLRMRGMLVATVVLNALRSDGAVVVDSRPFPVVLGHLWDVQEE